MVSAEASVTITFSVIISRSAEMSVSTRVKPRYRISILSFRTELLFSETSTWRSSLVEVSFKVLPAGRNVPVIPYIGGGAGLYYWQYEEIGDFVIDRIIDPTIISGIAYADGWDPGWHVEGGVQIPVGRAIALQFEAKYWKAEGDLDVTGFDPAFEPLDLSATMFSGGISIWF